MSTANADLASGSLLSLNNNKTPKTVARKVALLERSRPYSIRIVKRVQLPPLGTSQTSPEVDGSQPQPQPLPQQQYYGRLRLGLVEPELRKAEVELVKTWACSHRGERLIELQAAPIPVVEQVHQETPSSSSGTSSPTPVKISEGEEVQSQSPVFPPPPQEQKSITVRARRAPSKTSKMRKFSMRKKRGKKKAKRGKMVRSGSKQSQLLKSIEKDSSNFNGEEAEIPLKTSPPAAAVDNSSSSASSTSITSTGSSSSINFFNEAETMEVVASSLAHPAYINQCIVLLEFSEGADSASFAEVITFKVNCVSSQFPAAYRGKLALILEIFAYDLPMTSSSTTDSNTNLGRSASVSSQASVSAADHRRLDLASWPLFILWPGGAERRLAAEAEKEKERTSKPNLGGGGGSLLKIKDEQLEALHDSLQVLPGLGPQGNLPPFYWDLLPGRGLFAAILEAPALTTTTLVNGTSSTTLTTLTKGTSYRLRLKCFNFVTGSGVNPVKLRSVVSLRLKGPGINSVADETERFANWTLMNGIGGQGQKKGAPPMLDIDLEKCLFSSDPPVAVLDVFRPSGPGQSFSLLWSVVGQRPTEEMIIAFKINVSSEAFFGTPSSSVHFSLTVDTFNESFEGGGRQMDSLGALVDVVGEEGQKVTETPVSNSQPSFNLTLLRTAEEFTVKVIIFVSFEPESLGEYFFDRIFCTTFLSFSCRISPTASFQPRGGPLSAEFGGAGSQGRPQDAPQNCLLHRGHLPGGPATGQPPLRRKRSKISGYFRWR